MNKESKYREQRTNVRKTRGDLVPEVEEQHFKEIAVMCQIPQVHKCN